MYSTIDRIKHWIKDSYIIIKYYTHKTKKSKNEMDGTLFFYVREGYPQPHPGLVDRIKTIVSLYFLAKENNLEFRVWFDYPFELQYYLVPNRYDWSCNVTQISKRKKEVQLIRYDLDHDIKFDTEKKQYHCYYYEGKNIIQKENNKGWEKQWHKLYQELFKPSKHLEELIHANVPSECFVAVHLRFVNALDSFERTKRKKLTQSEKQRLIDRCIEQLEKLREKEEKIIYVFSDSIRFLEVAREKGFSMLSTDNIGHISCENDTKVHDKTFLDLYAMSLADKVYVIHGENLYDSVFPKYASVIGNKEFEILNL